MTTDEGAFVRLLDAELERFRKEDEEREWVQHFGSKEQKDAWAIRHGYAGWEDYWAPFWEDEQEKP